MKKKLILTMLVCTALFTGCGSASTNTASKTETSAETSSETESKSENEVDTQPVSTETQEEKSNSQVTDADFDKKEYLFEDEFGDTVYFVAVKNNSDTAVSIQANGTALDKDGKSVGAATMSIDVLGPDEESMGLFFFSDVSDVEKVTYQMSYDTQPYCKPVLSNLSVEQTDNDGNVTVTVTNNGDCSAQFLNAYALFLDADGNVINYTSNYLTDNDEELKAGETMSTQLTAYEDYDHTDVYLIGRNDGTDSSSSESGIDDSDFTVTEHMYTNGIGDSLYILTVKNNSSETVNVDGNATALDEAGTKIGAADTTIDVLGPNEESIAYFYFNGVENIANVDYKLSYSEETYYSPVLSNLKMEESVNDSNVVVSVTNNDSQPAEFVQAYAVFYDADNNVVGFNSNYLTDGDQELKEGATLSTQLDCYEPFDHAEVYLTGRGE